jgi:hypothetical protein
MKMNTLADLSDKSRGFIIGGSVKSPLYVIRQILLFTLLVTTLGMALGCTKKKPETTTTTTPPATSNPEGPAATIPIPSHT